MAGEGDLVAAYWREAAERVVLMHGTREQRIEYQTRSFPVEESLATRIDEQDPSLVDDLARIAEAAPDEEALGLFGAGIVWELLYNGGDGNADSLLKHAETSPAFLTALKAGFAGWDGLPPNTSKKLKPLIDADG